ncbi:WecB/TagA/CpsF family glycosyltransferase [Telluribacter sp. SYSU D00476]|uniref:WecB/TagA/CpsF family glycosyltransferase n=1 Tax=Telluribacter sp. SYSU D00476 TaxID=2811430 RepID=UPI001FF4BBE3|nr:WecB/TagA/CpsF family glycosyltransferase [Telluribacter sp. SYSU D00476]
MRKPLLETYITTGSYDTFVEKLTNIAKSKISSYVCVANVHMIVEAYKSSTFAKIVNDADIVAPDGVPLSIGLKWLYGTHQDRVAGMDLLPSLLLQAEKQELNVFFFGSTPEVLDAMRKRCMSIYPNLKIAGAISPPFRPLNKEEDEAIAQRINLSGAHIVFVALGCPKQEKWMAEMKGKVNALMIGLGGAFPVFAGLQSRAPIWMQRMSLEWLFRLYQEPGRLWKRYLTTNPLFILLFIKEWYKVRLLKISSN